MMEMDFHTVQETVQAKREVLSPCAWPSSPKRRQRPTAAVTAHFISSSKWPVTRSVRVHRRKSVIRVFTSVEENSPFCLNRPLSGHQYSYKCPTMSCTQQKKDYWNQCLHDGILECSGIIYIYIYEYRQTNALGTWGLVFRCRLCADVFCNTDKR